MKLKGPVTVWGEGLRVVAALQRLHRDVGSVAHRLVATDDGWPPPVSASRDTLRVLCVACADHADVEKLARDLARELAGDPEAFALVRNVAVELTGGLHVVVFRDVPCLKGDH